ncbi:signal recognition particle 9 kDa protein-like [Paramacrobiotus metropolitanus]|uniref:signal recognition particle 9 kDa protein-like n=1 Tax=Paramacrobiotus metropolitanus TaxID=2943436 RepID=UPI002445E10F|nr:signal recognition particle 9 kDa protein-like [Paramacrobiotus metropolitanus]
MVNIVSWDDFSKRAEELYLADPGRVRFTIKYRESDGEVILKMTDDKTCLKYHGTTSRDVKRAEKFSSLIMRYMASKE